MQEFFRKKSRITSRVAFSTNYSTSLYGVLDTKRKVKIFEVKCTRNILESNICTESETFIIIIIVIIIVMLIICFIIKITITLITMIYNILC